MKLPAPAAGPAPISPAAPAAAPADDLNFGGEIPTDTTQPQAPSDDKPFDDEPFDAGVEADETTDPKKFIEQLTGKLGQSLRKYNEEQGQPDFELEKFAINSLLSATHTSEMDEEDKNDIIKKVNTAGNDESQDSDMGDKDNTDGGEGNNNGPDNSDSGNLDFGGGQDDKGLEEYSIYESNENIFLKNPKKNNMFQPGSNDVLDENKPCWKGYEQIGMKNKNGKEVPNCVPIKENHEGGESLNYMFWQNLKTIHHAAGELLEMNQQQIDDMCANGHAWAVDHVASSADDIEEVYHFFEANLEDESMDYDGKTEAGYQDDYGSVDSDDLYEGKYDDKPLGKPMQGDVKKFKVYVKNAKGNVVKVNFGDPNMEIKRDNPERKKAFRARHNCAEAKDRTTPKYWSCKMWSSTPVSKLVGENLINSEKNSIFDKNILKSKLQETFNQEDMSEPMVQPIVKPVTKPAEPATPSRKNKPFTIEPDTIPQPNPKALTEGKEQYPVYHNTFSSAVQTAQQYAESKGYNVNEDEWFNSIATGPKKPKEGETNRYSISLYKDGKLQKKHLHIQVYGMVNKYELNAYIA